MIYWIAGGVAIALIASLATVLIKAESLKAGGYVLGTCAVIASAVWAAFNLENTDRASFVAARFLVAYYGLYLIALAYYGPRAFVARRKWRQQQSAAHQATEEARQRELEANQAAELHARQQAEARQRAAAFAQRLATLEEWCLKMYPYYNIQVDFDGSQTFEQKRAGFQAYLQKSNVSDLHILLHSRNPQVQALVLGMVPAAIR